MTRSDVRSGRRLHRSDSAAVRHVKVGASLALWVSLVLALSGCLGGGPSDTDARKVGDALGALGADWSVEYVDNSGSDSEGFDHYLAVGLHHDTTIDAAGIVDVFASISDTLPSSYRWRIKVSLTVGADGLYPDLTRQASTLGMDPGYESFYESGVLWTSVKEMRRIVKENGA